MKKLNLLLMMFASLTLLLVSSCKDNDENKTVTEITLAVSGGTSVTLEKADIIKDVIVTASVPATQDIAVALSSNAAEGEASFEASTITIKKGEKSAVGKITFYAAKFPEGTAEKKIIVTIKTQTEHVTPDPSTTDFLVKGINGKELIPLTIAGNATEFNTTAGEQTLTVTATLTAAAGEEVSIAIGYEGTDANLKELFKDITAIKIPADQKTGVATFKVGKGVEGALKLAFTTTNLKVDLQTKTLAATFAVDKNKLVMTGDAITLETFDGDKTLNVTATITDKLTTDLVIALTYDGSDPDIKALFASRTSITLTADAKSISEGFTVPKGKAGKLVINFATDNNEVSIAPASLTTTFTYTVPPITPLCAIEELNNTWTYLAGFKIGETTVEIAATDPAYHNKLGETTANITDGDEVAVFAGSKDKVQRIYGHVWVDWNKDNQVTADEMVGTTTTQKLLSEGVVDKTFLVFNFTAPETAISGEYHMRIGTNHKSGLGGCTNPADDDESRTAYDLTINYTVGGEEPDPIEDPTFAVVKGTPTGEIVVPATGVATATFNVTLSKPSEEAQTINLATTSSNTNNGTTLTPAQVVFAIGEVTKPVTITFPASVFASDDITANITVTGTSTSGLEATAAAIVYSVKGTKADEVEMQDLNCYLEKQTDNNDENVFLKDGETSRTIDFFVASDADGQVGDISFDVTVTGAAASDYSFVGVTDGKVIMTAPASGKGQVAFQVIINESAIGKTLSVNIESKGTTIQDRYKSRLCKVQRLSVPSSPLDYQVDYTVEGAKSVTITKAQYVYVTLTTKNGEDPSQPLILTPITTGDMDISPMDDYVLMTENGQEARFYVRNSGTSGTLTFESDYTNFADGAKIDFTVQK